MSRSGGLRWNPSAFARSRDGRRDATLSWLTPAWIAIAAALGLSLLGIEAIATTRPDSATRQWMFLPIGLVAALVVAAPDYRRYRMLVPLLAAGVLLHLPHFILPAPPDYRWAEHCDAIRRGVPANIHTLPEGWWIEYPGHPQRTSPP